MQDRTCTTSRAGAVFSPYSSPLTRPNSTGLKLDVGIGCNFSEVCLDAGALASEDDVCCCWLSGAALSAMAGLDEPHPIA